MTPRSTTARANNQFKQRLQAETAILPTVESEVRQLHTAVDALRRADYDRAEKIFRKVLVDSPESPDALHGLGIIELHWGRPAEAAELFERAVATGAALGQFFVNLAVALENSGREDEALQILKRGISQHPLEAILHQSLGVFLHNRKQDDKALRSLEHAVRLDPNLARIHRMLADIHFEHKRHEKSFKHYQLNLEELPGDKHSLARMAYILGSGGRHQEALDLLMPIYEDGIEDPDICNNIGSALINLGRIDDAEKYILRAQELDPNRWEFNSNVAGLHLHREDLDGAIKVFLRIRERHPDEPRTAVDLGMAYMRQGRSEEAMAEILDVIEAHPDHDPAWTARGILHSNKFEYHKAEEAYRKALEINPLNVHANSNLSLALRNTGDLDDAAFFAHKTVNLADYVPLLFGNVFQVFHSVCDHGGLADLGNLQELVDGIPAASLGGCIFNLMVHAKDVESARWLASVNRRWAEALEESAARDPLPVPKKRPKHKKVRVGFLSADLRTHSVGRLIMPLMKNYDHERLDFYGYATWEATGDPLQIEMRELMNGELRTVADMSGRDIAEVIRGDEIDILFDLNGHTLGARLDAIPFRPAPVQVTWLGYPFTTGLKDMDYFLLDKRNAPVDHSLMVEKPLLMPESWTTMDEYPDIPITDVLPCERNGYITFGTLNNPYKFTPQMYEAWARVLKAVPDSRLVFVRGEAKSRVFCSNVAIAFSNLGISTERLGFFDNKTEDVYFLDCYNAVDITLDTFPVTGGTTTCDAMWMGVPVVSLIGESHHQRISYSLLGAVGLDELCTSSVDEYVQVAVDLANDVESLKFLRENLRPRLLESSLCDAARFSKSFCDVMEQLARDHDLI